ncbi:MAG: Mov34/MPN/PAD-1 family protein [Planctomycetales bacterium]|nr:Mov34/MPN/PAD-1 family protein [Planctomycetales bacterium]
MSQIDVRQLPDNEALAEAPFPAPRQADFRVHLSPSVHQGIADHAGADTSVEICGVLVGTWNRDEDGPYAVVTEYIRCDSATSKFAEVTFTHESWAQINQEMDSEYADLRIVGWYHSHPDFGIFLSDRDCFIQENCFSGAGQVAYVVDPVRKLEGIFEWRDGKPQPMPHYWVGEKIIPVEASKKSPRVAARESDRATSQPTTDPVSAAPPHERQLTFQLLLWLGLFLMGYLLASMNSRWERERIIQGTVAHYGVNKLMRLGFEGQLRETRRRLELIGNEVDALLEVDQSKLDDEGRKEFDARTRRVSEALALSGESLLGIEEVYGYDDAERAALASYIVAKQAELTTPRPSPDSASKGTASSPEKSSGDGGNKVKTKTAPAAESESASSQQAPDMSPAKTSRSSGGAPRVR